MCHVKVNKWNCHRYNLRVLERGLVVLMCRRNRGNRGGGDVVVSRKNQELSSI